MPIVALDEGLQREPDARRHVLGEGRGERRLRPLRAVRLLRAATGIVHRYEKRIFYRFGGGYVFSG